MSTSADVEKKSGRPPAVKAGGMRVAHHRKSSSSESKEKNEMTKEEMEQYASSPPKQSKEVLVSVALIREDRAFPPAAIKHYHDKPVPSPEKRHVQLKYTINQPICTINQPKHTISKPKHTINQSE